MPGRVRASPTASPAGIRTGQAASERSLMTDAAQITIPDGLRPRDGRFGSGPGKVRPEALAALAASGPTYMGTSHRQPPVKGLVRRVRAPGGGLFWPPPGGEGGVGHGGGGGG